MSWFCGGRRELFSDLQITLEIWRTSELQMIKNNITGVSRINILQLKPFSHTPRVRFSGGRVANRVTNPPRSPIWIHNSFSSVPHWATGLASLSASTHLAIPICPGRSSRSSSTSATSGLHLTCHNWKLHTAGEMPVNPIMQENTKTQSNYARELQLKVIKQQIFSATDLQPGSPAAVTHTCSTLYPWLLRSSHTHEFICWRHILIIHITSVLHLP